MSYPTFHTYFSGWRTPITTIGEFFYQCKNAWQRVRRGYSDEDCEHMRWWFDGVIPDMLEQFSQKLDHPLAGIPMPFVKQFYERHKEELGISYSQFLSFRGPLALEGEWNDRLREEGIKQWKGTIEEIRRLMLEANEDTCSRKNPYSYDDEHDAYRKAEDELFDYQLECRKQAFALLAQWLGHIYA